MDEKKRKEIDEWLKKDKQRADAYAASQKDDKEESLASKWKSRLFDREEKYDIGTLPKKKEDEEENNYEDGGIASEKGNLTNADLEKELYLKNKDLEKAMKPKKEKKSFSKLIKMLEKSHR